MRFHYFQHVPYEGLGCIAQWLEVHGCQVSATKFYEHDYQLPDVNTIDALIIMGGPMGVYDEYQYPWQDVPSISYTCKIYITKIAYADF